MSKENSSGGEGGQQDTSGPDSPSDVPAKDPNADLYDNRGPKKIIRVVTVMAYLFSVSFVGILLSAYYIFLWEPPNPRLIGAGPQVQFLIAAAPSPEMPNLKEKEAAFPLESHPNHKSLLGRMTQDVDSTQRQPDGISLEKQARLNTMLLNLRQSLVEVLRAQKRNSSQQVAANASDGSFVEVKRVLNSTKKTDYATRSISRQDDESRGNVARETTLSDNTDRPSEFADPINTLDLENTSAASKSATIPGTQTNQNYFDGKSIPDAADRRYSTPITIDRGTTHRNGEGKVSAQRFSKLHTARQESTKRNESNVNDRQLIAPVGDNAASPSDDPSKYVRPTIITIVSRLVEYVENRTGSREPSGNANVNGLKLNYFNNNNNNKSPSNNRNEHIARSHVSDELTADSDFIEEPEFEHQLPNYPIVVKPPALYTTRDVKETRRMQLPRKMSAHNVMASIGRTLGNRESKPPAPNEVRFAGDERKDKLYEPKHKQKLVRVLTVVAYVIFVSMAAILLSLYYTFVWNPTDQAARRMRLNRTECPLPDSMMTSSISNETHMEKMTVRSTTMNNNRHHLPEQMDSSTTERQRGLWQVLTGTADTEETSIELMSISTTRNHRNNLTNIANDDDESVT